MMSRHGQISLALSPARHPLALDEAEDLRVELQALLDVVDGQAGLEGAQAQRQRDVLALVR